MQCGLTETEWKSQRQKIMCGREASFSLTSLPLSHLCPSPPLNPAACGGKTNRVHPVAAAPGGLGGAFWKVIPAHCSGLKCCHAELVPNCFAATPPHPPTTTTKQPASNKQDIYCIWKVSLKAHVYKQSCINIDVFYLGFQENKSLQGLNGERIDLINAAACPAATCNPLRILQRELSRGAARGNTKRYSP